MRKLRQEIWLKIGPFDNIRFLQLRFRCKYYKKHFAYRSECSEITGKNLF